MVLLECQKVDFFHSQGLSNRNIAKKVNRSSRTVDRYLKVTEEYGKNFKGKKEHYLNKQYAKLLELHQIRQSNSTISVQSEM